MQDHPQCKITHNARSPTMQDHPYWKITLVKNIYRMHSSPPLIGLFETSYAHLSSLYLRNVYYWRGNRMIKCLSPIIFGHVSNWLFALHIWTATEFKHRLIWNIGIVFVLLANQITSLNGKCDDWCYNEVIDAQCDVSRHSQVISNLLFHDLLRWK